MPSGRPFQPANKIASTALRTTGATREHIDRDSKLAGGTTDAIYDRHIRTATERDREIRRFYSSTAWRETRNKKLATNRTCEHHGCSERATIVHHIKPVRERWDLRLTWSNLASLCGAHHAGVHRHDNKRSPGSAMRAAEDHLRAGVKRSGGIA